MEYMSDGILSEDIVQDCEVQNGMPKARGGLTC